MRGPGKLSRFLGIRVIRDRRQRKLWLCQDSYIRKTATTFHLTDRKPLATPLATEELLPNTEQATTQEIYLYQRKIRSLLYATTITRLDAARVANKLSEFLFLALDAQHIFTCTSDAAFADDPVTRHCTEECLVKLFGGLID
jgi:hypothetical protein